MLYHCTIIESTQSILYNRLMKTGKDFTIAFMMTLFCGVICAQTPANDQNWQLNTGLSDEFNGTSLDGTKWQALDCPTGVGANWGGSSAFSSQNVSVSGGILNLKCDGPASQGFCFNYPLQNIVGYKTAGIWSLNESYSYGYLEIYAQLPGFIDGNGVAHADKFWPAIWTYHQEFTGSCETDHDELDIMDQCCNEYSDAKTIGYGGYDHDVNCTAIGWPTSLYTNSVPLCNSYHKYAVEWNTNKVIFYFDDLPLHEIYTSVSMNPMKAVIDLQLDGSSNFYSGAPFPEYMNLDYYRYYQLNKACSTSATILNNTDLANYIFSVKSDITFGNGANSVSLNSTDVKYFRAVNSITINGDFTVPLGAEFGLLPTDCN